MVCPGCKSDDVVRWGLTRIGTARFKCCDCGQTFCRDAKMNTIPELKKKRLISCYLSGYSIRLGARLAEVHKNTARLYYAEFKHEFGQVQCPCGLEAGHKGWCAWRFRQSSKRMTSLKSKGHWLGEVGSGLYDLPPLSPKWRRDGNVQRLCGCGCASPVAMGRLFAKGHRIEEIQTREEKQWLKKAARTMRKIRRYLRNPGVWESPKKASRQGTISPTS